MENRIFSVRTLNPGQNNAVDVKVLPYTFSVQSICASFCIYALTMGYDKAKVYLAFLGLQSLIFNAMANGVEVLTVAPKLWWIIVNAVKPKSVDNGVQRINFSFDTSFLTSGTQSVVNIQGALFGKYTGLVDPSGFPLLDDSTYVLPTLMQAANDVSDLFNFYPKFHPLVKNDGWYRNDASIYSWRITIYGGAGGQDNTNSSFGLNILEVPITSWLGYLGMAEQEYAPDYQSTRVPVFVNSSEGASGHHVGLRLHYAKFMEESNLLSIKLKPVAVDVMAYQDCQARRVAYQRQLNAGRPDITNTAYIAVKPGAFALNRFINYTSLMFSHAHMWFGAWQTYPAIAVGTNNLDASDTSGMTEAYFSVGSLRQLAPYHNVHSNSFIIPFPTANEGSFLQVFELASGLVMCGDNSNPNYENLDIMNSVQATGGLPIAWAGPFIADDRQAVKESDAAIQNMIPTASPLAFKGYVTTNNIEITKVLENPNGIVSRSNTLDSIKKSVRPGLGTKVIIFQGPSALSAVWDATISDNGFKRNFSITNAMTTTISNYVYQTTGLFSDNVLISRIIQRSYSSYQPGVQGTMPYTDNEISNVHQYVKDPESAESSEAAEEVLMMSRGLSEC